MTRHSVAALLEEVKAARQYMRDCGPALERVTPDPVQRFIAKVDMLADAIERERPSTNDVLTDAGLVVGERGTTEPRSKWLVDAEEIVPTDGNTRRVVEEALFASRGGTADPGAVAAPAGGPEDAETLFTPGALRRLLLCLYRDGETHLGAEGAVEHAIARLTEESRASALPVGDLTASIVKAIRDCAGEAAEACCDGDDGHEPGCHVGEVEQWLAALRGERSTTPTPKVEEVDRG
jgi:hypothetical protein